MKGWTEQRISDVYEALFDGPHATPAPTNEGKIFLRIENITEDGRLDFSNPTFISNEEFPRWTRRVIPQVGDVVFSYEATLGRYAIIPNGFDGCLGRRIALIRPNQRKINPKFLLYYFFGHAWQHEINNYLVTGSTVDRIPLIKFPRFKILTPPLPIQRKIAAVLSAYDDLIENNNRRIALLEKMGEELYREWFVRLRFPGHESTKIVKGVPEGWRVGQISEICSDVRSHVKLRNLDANSRYIGLEHITPKSMILKDHGCGGDVQSDKISFRPYDILFGKIRPYLEKVSISHFEGICSTDAIVLRPKSENLLGFVFLTVSSASFLDLANTASKGTKMPRADWDFLAQQKIVLPPPDLQTRFDSQFRPILSAAIRYQSQAENCCLARDRLLTRLMSGKIDLEALDIAFPSSMQEAA